MLDINKQIKNYMIQLEIDMVAESTKRNISSTLNQFEDVALLEDAETYKEAIMLYLRWLSKEHTNRKTINVKRSRLSAFFAYLYRSKVVDEDYSGMFTKVQVDRTTEVDPLSVDDVLQITKYLDHEVKKASKTLESSHNEDIKNNYYAYFLARRTALAFHTFLATGMRISELVPLKKNSIDLLDQSITFYQIKSKKHLTNPLHRAYVDYVRNYMDTFTALDRQYGLDLYTRSDYFFYSRKDPSKYMTTRNMYRLIVEMFKSLGLDYSPHKIRHTYGSLIASSDLKSASEMMGHSSSMITATFYHHGLGKERNRKAMNEGLNIIYEKM